MLNDFTINVATVNGSGSQSANNILSKTIFRMGIPVGSKNTFPSNIQGLPTWFYIRINKDGFVSRKQKIDIVVAMNKSTLLKDYSEISDGDVFFYNEDFKLDESFFYKKTNNIPLPIREMSKDLTKSVKLKKLLANMIYVGALSELLEIPFDILKQTITDQFNNKANVVESNLKACLAGIDYIKSKDFSIPQKLKSLNLNSDKILIDGNAAGALGLVYGGCSVMAWYPITPSSSVAENFEHYANILRDNSKGNNFAIVQAEDELASIGTVLGAGWAGCRSATTTSGPGMSLMAEAAGLSYFAEIPAVLWNVQRAGPSTGLPTRTMQCDILSAYKLSHGDTEHVVLIPSNPKECFEFGQKSLELAEVLQTLVIVLTDLDLGMNNWISDEFEYDDSELNRGKVLSVDDLNKMEDFARYKDIDGDGVPYRTLPGTNHPNGAYFTRGTGHDEYANYSESPDVFKKKLERLKSKIYKNINLLPQPEITSNKNAKIGILYYGSTKSIINEVEDFFNKNKVDCSYLCIKALPLCNSVNDFINQYEKVFVIEQNRDAQLKSIIQNQFPETAEKLCEILQYDGLSIGAEYIISLLSKEL